MRKNLVLLLVFFLSIQYSKTQSVYRDLQLLDPKVLIINTFKEKEVVFLGEIHWVKQFVDFAGEIIPELHKNGVNILFYEFLNYSDTPVIDSVLTSDVYDEKKVFKMMHKSEWDWNYREYADVIKSAWSVNKNRKPGEAVFRVIGLDSDKDYSAIKVPGDWSIDDKRRQFFNYEKSPAWENVIQKEALDKKMKALVYCGRAHSFTSFSEPVYSANQPVYYLKNREGFLVNKRNPGKTATILFYVHLPEKPTVDGKLIKPFNGVLDSLADILPANNKNFGFSTKGSVLGSRTDSACYYSVGYGTIKLKEFCDGVIVSGPASDLKPVTFIENFITEDNLELTRIQDYPYNFTGGISVKAYNDSLRSYYQQRVKGVELLRK